jgi:hypothetical protein
MYLLRSLSSSLNIQGVENIFQNTLNTLKLEKYSSYFMFFPCSVPTSSDIWFLHHNKLEEGREAATGRPC